MKWQGILELALSDRLSERREALRQARNMVVSKLETDLSVDIGHGEAIPRLVEWKRAHRGQFNPELLFRVLSALGLRNASEHEDLKPSPFDTAQAVSACHGFCQGGVYTQSTSTQTPPLDPAVQRASASLALRPAALHAPADLYWLGAICATMTMSHPPSIDYLSLDDGRSVQQLVADIEFWWRSLPDWSCTLNQFPNLSQDYIAKIIAIGEKLDMLSEWRGRYVVSTESLHVPWADRNRMTSTSATRPIIPILFYVLKDTLTDDSCSFDRWGNSDNSQVCTLLLSARLPPEPIAYGLANFDDVPDMAIEVGLHTGPPNRNELNFPFRPRS